MNTLGTKKSLIVIGDTDGLIAILHEDDKNHVKAKETARLLLQNDVQTIFPLTSIVETVTTLKRKLNKPKLAVKVVKQITGDLLTIEEVDTKLLNKALAIFNPAGSKQNTLFDAIVATCAKKYKADAIFSFDKWYEKIGFKLTSNLF